MMNIELNPKLSIVFMMYKNDLQATHSTISVTCEVWRSIDRVRQAFAAANHQPADSVHGDASNQTLILTHLRNFATIWSYRMLKWFFKTAISNKHMILLYSTQDGVFLNSSDSCKQSNSHFSISCSAWFGHIFFCHFFENWSLNAKGWCMSPMHNARVCLSDLLTSVVAVSNLWPCQNVSIDVECNIYTNMFIYTHCFDCVDTCLVLGLQ